MKHLATAILLAACGSSGTPCEPGAPQACACPGSSTLGTQICAADGLSLTKCSGCAPAPDAATNPAPAACGPGIYPCGPYGYDIGSTIENLALIGQRDDNGNGHVDRDDTVVVLTLADLAAGAQALVIDICAEWCGPCRTDQPNLNALANSYGSQVAFFDVMIQDNTGRPGTLAAVDRWGTSLSVPYPVAADPTGLTGPYFPIAGFPMHLVIKTSDMTIAAANVGAGDDLMGHIDEVLANP